MVIPLADAPVGTATLYQFSVAAHPVRVIHAFQGNWVHVEWTLHNPFYARSLPSVAARLRWWCRRLDLSLTTPDKDCASYDRNHAAKNTRVVDPPSIATSRLGGAPS